MRFAEVSGLTGPGNVSAIYEVARAEALTAFLVQQGRESRAIAAPAAWVLPGVEFDGEDFVEPAPEPEPEAPPTAPLSIAQVKASLDSLRQQEIDTYVAQWGAISKDEMWPKLADEIKAIAAVETEEKPATDYPSVQPLLPDFALVPVSPINIEQYPSLKGFLIGSGFSFGLPNEATEAEASALRLAHQVLILTTARVLRGHQEAHIALIRYTEIKRKRLVQEYAGLSEAEKLDWDAEAEWAVLEVG